jgi:hypothetical protein
VAILNKGGNIFILNNMIFLTIVVKELLHKAINNIVFGQQLKPTYQGIQAWHSHF